MRLDNRADSMTVLSPSITCRCLALFAAALLQACASTNPALDLPPAVEQQRIEALQRTILALDASVDRDEARRAAIIAFEYPLELAEAYQISDPPLVHNVLVNLGIKPRGLCVDWTADLITRLREERFRSLDLHWGVANHDSLFRIEHSTVIISARNQHLEQGVVLDPWRNGGDLFWSPTLEDPAYEWQPHAEVHAEKRERKAQLQNRAQVR